MWFQIFTTNPLHSNQKKIQFYPPKNLGLFPNWRPKRKIKLRKALFGLDQNILVPKDRAWGHWIKFHIFKSKLCCFDCYFVTQRFDFKIDFAPFTFYNYCKLFMPNGKKCTYQKYFLQNVISTCIMHTCLLYSINLCPFCLQKTLHYGL